MDNHEKVQLMTLGQFKEIIVAFIRALPADMPFDDAQAWVGAPQKDWVEMLRRGPRSVTQLRDWLRIEQTFYRNVLGIDVDFSTMRIPESHTGLDRVLFIPQGLTPNGAVEIYRRLNIPIRLYTEDLDSALDWDKEERNPKNGSYAICVRDRQEADEELKNLSAIQIAGKRIATETLSERLIHGAVYFLETGHHLDEYHTTFCCGSRRRWDGGVPVVNWSRPDNAILVSWYSPAHSYGLLRSREVVY